MRRPKDVQAVMRPKNIIYKIEFSTHLTAVYLAFEDVLYIFQLTSPEHDELYLSAPYCHLNNLQNLHRSLGINTTKIKQNKRSLGNLVLWTMLQTDIVRYL